MNTLIFRKQICFGKFIAAFLLFVVINSQIVFSQSVQADLSSESKTINIGDLIVVNLKVSPDANSPIFTVMANLVYDPSILELKDVTMSGEWMEVSQKPNAITDTVNGLITRTGGYPNGILGKADFVTYKFKANKAGDANILIAGGRAYNESNNDQGLTNASLKLRILDDELSENIKGVENVFNLNLKINGNSAVYKQDSYSLDLFSKKQDVNQLAMTKIWVFNEDAKLYHEDERIWNTGVDNALHFVIPANTLDEGNYRIIAKVRYENGLEETVAEKSIGVLSNGQTWFTQNRPLFWPIFFVIILVSIVHHVFVEREVYRKLQILNKTLKKTKKNSSY